MLEVSLRKLVREEAAKAAVETIEKVGDDLAKAVRAGAVDAIQEGTRIVGLYRRVNWSDDGFAATVAARPLPEDVPADTLLAARTRALELAVSIAKPDAAAELTAAHAAIFAAFILDGYPSVQRRAPVPFPSKAAHLRDNAGDT